MAEGNVYARMSAVLSLDNSEFLTKLERTTKKLGAFSKKTERLGKSLTRNLSLPLALIGAAAAKLAVDFEKQLATVAAVSGATEKQLDSLRKSALELGASTVFSAKQVAELQESLARLGFTADEINGVTQSILALAQATGTDLAEAAEIVGTAIRSFNLNVEEAAHVADVFALATANSALSMETLKESFSEFAPLAASLGLSIEQTSGLLAVLADRGIKGSKAGNALKAVFAGLAKSGTDFNTAIEGVRSGAIGFDEAMELVGRRGATALLALGQVSDRELRLMIGQFENAEGAALGMAAVMDDTAFGSLKALQSATQGLGISMGDTLKPLLEEVTKALTGLARRLDAMTPRQKRFASALALALAALGPMLLLVSKLSKGLQFLTKTYQAQLGAILAHNEAKKKEAASTTTAAAGTVADTTSKTANAAATNVATTASVRFAAALRTVRAALASTGIGLIVVGLGVLAERFLAAASAADESKNSINEWDKVQNRIEESTQGVANRLYNLAEAYRELAGDTERQAAALEQIKTQDEDLVDGLEAGVSTYDELIGRINEYIGKLKEQARVQAAGKLLAEASEQQVKVELARDSAERLFAGEQLSDREFARLTEVFEGQEIFIPFRGDIDISEGFKDIRSGDADANFPSQLRAALLGEGKVFDELQGDVKQEIDTLTDVVQSGTEKLGSGIKVGAGIEAEKNAGAIESAFNDAESKYREGLANITRRIEEGTLKEEDALEERLALTNTYLGEIVNATDDAYTAQQRLAAKQDAGETLNQKEKDALTLLNTILSDGTDNYRDAYKLREELVKAADLQTDVEKQKEELKRMEEQAEAAERRAQAERVVNGYLGDSVRNAESVTQTDINKARSTAVKLTAEAAKHEEDLQSLYKAKADLLEDANFNRLKEFELAGDLIPMEKQRLSDYRAELVLLDSQIASKQDLFKLTEKQRNSELQTARILQAQLVAQNTQKFFDKFAEGKGSVEQLANVLDAVEEELKAIDAAQKSLEKFTPKGTKELLEMLSDPDTRASEAGLRLLGEIEQLEVESGVLEDLLGEGAQDAIVARVKLEPVGLDQIDFLLENDLINPIDAATEKARLIAEDFKNDQALVRMLDEKGLTATADKIREGMVGTFQELIEQVRESDPQVAEALEAMTETVSSRMSRINAAVAIGVGFVNMLRDSFFQAQESGESFGKTLATALKNAFKQIAVTIIALIALFIALAVAIALATGGMNLKGAAAKLGGVDGGFFRNMGAFVGGQGFGISPDSFAKSAPAGGGDQKLALVVRGTDLHTASVGANNSSRRLYGE